MKKHPTEIHVRADVILAEIGHQQRYLEKAKSEAEAEIDEIKKAYSERIKTAEMLLKAYAVDLRKLAKTNHAVLFDGKDRIDLNNGAMIFSISDRVKRAKSITTDKLEEMGLDEAVRIAKSVDWDELEKWPDEKLIAVGTERVRQEKYEYEVFETAEDAEKK